MYSVALLVLSAIDVALVLWILREWLKKREAVLGLLLFLAAGLGRLGGLSWLQPRVVMGGVCVVATAFLVADWRHILQFDPLYPACWADSVRYVPSVAAEQACVLGQAGIGAAGHLPPAFAIGVPLLFIVGALLWWRARWPWMFVGIARPKTDNGTT